jgi:hypothetical protein
MLACLTLTAVVKVKAFTGRGEEKESDTKGGAALRGNESAGGYRGRCVQSRLAEVRSLRRWGGPPRARIQVC